MFKRVQTVGSGVDTIPGVTRKVSTHTIETREKVEF
jgi:hypothetical protein